MDDSPLRMEPHRPRRVAVRIPIHASQDLELRDFVFGPLSSENRTVSLTVILSKLGKLLTRVEGQLTTLEMEGHTTTRLADGKPFLP